jgi:F-type H+-transporting ATPase subunit alpha
VGGDAQTKAMKKIAGTLRLDLAQYREMQAFAQFASDLDKATQMQLARGERLTELLKQGQYQPMAVEQQILVIYAGARGHVDHLSVNKLARYESELIEFFVNKHSDVLKSVREVGKLEDDIVAGLEKGLAEFTEVFQA